MRSKRVSPKTDVICDACGQAVTLDDSKIKAHRFSDGIHISYFACENCGAKYITIITDAELRKDIKRRGFHSSSEIMKLRYAELKMKYSDRVKELP